ncbi:MAG: hypothetical protein LBT94_02360, partial [Prevotellaceae bacterium]|nr:hypothetical protein [Prevotellaceae bacterium]
MDILINELSLTGQFLSVEHFANEGLRPFAATLKEITLSQNVLYKKCDLWSHLVTNNANLHSILVGEASRQYDEVRKFKGQLASLLEPYWENDRRHSPDCEYLYNAKNVCGQSLAEACERDKVVVSFTTHGDFSEMQLDIIKNQQKTTVDNLYAKGHYVEFAYQRQAISDTDYFEWKFANGQCSLLDNTKRFRRTGQDRQGQQVYQEIETGYYWYLDNFHKTHYEVFSSA